MKVLSKYLMIGATLALAGIFFCPIWKVELTAPQYPEGLTMVIWISKIMGGQPSDLGNINLLNHYIGMSPIKPASLPELTVMPVLAAIMIVLGLLAALLKEKKLRYAWVAGMLVAGVVGLVDFHTWEYKYGHNLNPDAPIKIPGMHYQPPFIGTKQFLNITATSYPEAGFYLALLSMALGIASLIAMRSEDGATGAQPKESQKQQQNQSNIQGTLVVIMLAAVSALPLSSCSLHTEGSPEAINYGSDCCTHCSMAIVDPRFVAEIVTDKGKTYRFDSIACLSSFAQTKSTGLPGDWHLWVADYSKPGTFIDAKKSWYLNEAGKSGPMGIGLEAFTSQSKARSYGSAKGAITGWQGVSTVVQSAKSWDDRCPTKS